MPEAATVAMSMFEETCGLRCRFSPGRCICLRGHLPALGLEGSLDTRLSHEAATKRLSAGWEEKEGREPKHAHDHSNYDRLSGFGVKVDASPSDRRPQVSHSHHPSTRQLSNPKSLDPCAPAPWTLKRQAYNPKPPQPEPKQLKIPCSSKTPQIIT